MIEVAGGLYAAVDSVSDFDQPGLVDLGFRSKTYDGLLADGLTTEDV